MSIKRIIAAPFIWMFGLILFLEDWLWHPLLNYLKQFSRWPWVQWLENKVRKLPPYGALMFFGVPLLVLFPFKFFGLYLISQGLKAAGLAVFIVAKIVGTGSAAWVYSLTEPALSKLAWFVRLRDKFGALKTKTYEYIKGSVSYRFMRRRLSASRAWITSKLRRSPQSPE
jgi:hypothetical protein